nr:unnamed protein product [Callosobruchus chinensis]
MRDLANVIYAEVHSDRLVL